MLWTEATAKLAQTIPNFQPRPNQDALARQIETSFGLSRHLLAQAGCGTGKSFGAGVPAIEQSKRTGLPVIVATETKALQDQYAEKDLPALQEIDNFRFAVLKGRSNYVCLAKADELEGTVKETVTAALTTAQSGEKEFSGEILDLGLDADTQRLLSTSSEECPGKKDCPFGEVCFTEKAKAKAKEANIVVVNHAVLAADLAVKKSQKLMGIPENKTVGILPHFGGVVVDEAHGFEDSVTNALGGDLTAGSLGKLAKEAANFLTDHSVKSELDKAVADVYSVVASILAKRQDKRAKNMPVGPSELNMLAQPIVALMDALQKVSGRVEREKIHGNDKALQQQKRLVKKIRNAAGKLAEFVNADADALVRWLELAEGKKGDALAWAPLSVSDFLREELWAKAPAVLMSATLALGSDFSFLAERLGVDDADSFDAGTPFDFKTQAMTFVPQIAVPAGATATRWRASSIAVTADLVKASNGRALLLFTSRTGMNEAHEVLAPMIERLGHKVLKQGDAPNKQLAAEFKADEHSVLFALKSFFTGMDIQGDALRLVVIDKLPFPVPTDVIFKARTDAQDRKSKGFNDNGFNKISVPTMALSILQAYGRLIRTVEDRGLVAILDSRLVGDNAKYYGKRIMAALPDAPVTTNLAEAVDYLENLEEVV